MKILIISQWSNPKTQGGIQTFIRCIKKMFPSNIIILTCGIFKKGTFKVEDVVEILRTRICKVIDKLLYRILRTVLFKKKVKKIKPDICILSTPDEINFIENKKIKKILVQHTGFDVYFSRYYLNDYKLLEKTKKELDCFVVLSQYDKIKLIEEFNFPIEKINVIRHSCEIPLRKKEKIKTKNLVMIARLTASKRFDLAIKAMKKLTDFNLNIYGSGEEEKNIKSLIEKEKIKNVKLCGATSEVVKRLDENSIFIMTSDYEGYGITNIEAMRRGLPIILRNTFAAAKDIIINNGILLEKKWDEDLFCEAVREVYNNYETYSKNSIKLGERHSLDIIKKEWEELFQSLLEQEHK